MLLPRTPGYERARLPYNLRYAGARPDAVVLVEDPADVAAVVRWANRFDVRIAARSGGHSYGGYSTPGRGVVVDLSKLGGVRVANGRARVGAGTRLIDLQHTLTRRGLSVPSGSCPSVGIAGLALGGGHGLAGRRFGLTSDNLEAATIVTADGRVRRVDRDTNADLFWALRGGGGGNFGIVTELTLQAHRARGAAWFAVSWPWSQAGQALAAWQRFAPHAPPALTSILSLGTTGGAGSPRVAALGQFFGSTAALRRLIRPLTRVDGASASAGSSSYFSLVLRWAGCLDSGFRGLPPVHALGVPRQVRLLRQAAAPAWAPRDDRLDRAPPAHPFARLGRTAARRLRRGAQPSGRGGHGVRPPRHAVLAPVPGLSRRRRGRREPSAGSKGAWRALRPFASGEAYQNYIDPRLDRWQRAYYAGNLERLREIKKQADPDFRFRFGQAIPPAA